MRRHPDGSLPIETYLRVTRNPTNQRSVRTNQRPSFLPIAIGRNIRLLTSRRIFSTCRDTVITISHNLNLAGMVGLEPTRPREVPLTAECSTNYAYMPILSPDSFTSGLASVRYLRHRGIEFFKNWWAGVDLNHRPSHMRGIPL